MTLAVGFVSGQTVDVQFMGSLLALQRDRTGPIIHIKSGPFLSHARNRVIELFLAGGWDRLLMVDADMVFDVADVDKLQANDAPAVTGLYVKHDGSVVAGYEAEVPGGQVSAFNHVPEKECVVDWAGLGFFIVDREALLLVQKEYGSHWFDYTVEETGMQAGEDISFCRRLKAVGVPILLDPKVRLGHCKTTPLYPEMFYERQ